MKRILVANRGEIALRVMKTIKRMGLESVAVYSDADQDAPHVVHADYAVHIGESHASKSYLDIQKIITAAKNTDADAIHPGYGFLSENSEFAKACRESGISFIGPPVEAIEIMGSKLAAKDAVKGYDIPLVPGYDKVIDDIEDATSIAENIGFPVLIKASAGGGGKGMRIVNNSEELKGQMQRAISEAQSAFGDGSVFIEKYIASPRHIEIQVIADTHGNVLHLFERECSIQRRHQKVIEEAPSAVIDEDIRAKMGQAATDVARACNYQGAGTVEFLLDEDKNFYFLEMNTRLQVEHPVTEMITGLDLVELQINIARGQELPFTQDDLSINGHAIELRVYAEDPNNNFLPSIGTLSRYEIPSGSGIRVDHGYREGMDIPIYYDPMIAKLVVHSQTRYEAIQKLKSAIADYHIEGIKTTLPFGSFVCDHDAFISGNFDTNFVEEHYKPDSKNLSLEERLAGLIAKKAFIQRSDQLKIPSKPLSNWKIRKE